MIFPEKLEKNLDSYFLISLKAELNSFLKAGGK